jgi:predicted alpha/beta-fold hydrolase
MGPISNHSNEEEDESSLLLVTRQCEASTTLGKEDNIEGRCAGVFRQLYELIVHNGQSDSGGLDNDWMRRTSRLVQSTLPNTPGGWSLLIMASLTAGLTYELYLQRRLTGPPFVLGQLPPNTAIRAVYDKLTATSDAILSRSIQPSLLVGTRAQLSSTAAYANGGPSANHSEYIRFREIYTMAADGAQIGVDWEVPRNPANRKEEVMHGPIQDPVVIILHGINNHSQFGYMKSLQRTFAQRGWNAMAVNFRGCGGVRMTTPRGYNAAYTGDLRSLVQQVASRMSQNDRSRIFLVGNSLGANVVTKYLGEEGLAGTLPDCVAGGVSLGNPMLFYSSQISFPFSLLMGLARKKTYWDQRHAIRNMNDPLFAKAKRDGIWSAYTIGALDQAAAPLMIRNDPYPPFGTKIGYDTAHDYWMDSGSYKVSSFISVPFLQVVAKDDFLCYATSQRLLTYVLANPNIMVVETNCGGHLVRTNPICTTPIHVDAAEYVLKYLYARSSDKLSFGDCYRDGKNPQKGLLVESIHGPNRHRATFLKQSWRLKTMVSIHKGAVLSKCANSTIISK